MSAKNAIEKADYFKSGVPRHRESYCAFLDVLGFSEKIRESFVAGDWDSLLKEFHKILSDRIASIKNNCDDSLLYFKSFTDNVIVAHPRFSGDLESEFAFVLWEISEYQYKMALSGFFIRGGLAFGPLFVDENSVYGPALLDAYELESKHAVNPIIVLSTDVMALVLRHLEFYHEKEGAPQNRDVWVNSDGRFFINYLSECILEGADDEYIDWNSLNKHGRNIEACLRNKYGVHAVFSKYAWLANYHNEFCETVSKYSGYSGTMKIPANRTSVKFKKLSELPSNHSYMDSSHK